MTTPVRWYQEKAKWVFDTYFIEKYMAEGENQRCIVVKVQIPQKVYMFHKLVFIHQNMKGQSLNLSHLPFDSII